MGERAGAVGRKRQGGDPWVAAVGARDRVPGKRRPARAPRDPYVLPAGSCGPRAVAGRWRGRAEVGTGSLSRRSNDADKNPSPPLAPTPATPAATHTYKLRARRNAQSESSASGVAWRVLCSPTRNCWKTRPRRKQRRAAAAAAAAALQPFNHQRLYPVALSPKNGGR